MLLMTGFPVAFVLGGSGLLFAFLGAGFGVFDLSLLAAFPQGIFGVMTNETLVAVPLFVFMGVMLERSRIAEDMLENMGRLFGSFPGGLAFSVSIVGALLAASTGIVGAAVVTMSLLSLPTMLRNGYDVSFSCGSIAAAGTLGQIIPPSIVLVLLADQLSVAFQNAQYELGNFAPDTMSVNDLFAGALFPGLMLVGLYIAYQMIYVALNPGRAPAISCWTDGGDAGSEGSGGRESRRHGETGGLAFSFQLLYSLAVPMLLILLVLGSILIGLASPSEAAGAGAIGVSILAGYRIDAARGRLVLLGAFCLAALLIQASFFDLSVQRDVPGVQGVVSMACALLLLSGLLCGVFIAFRRLFQHRDDKGERILESVVRSTMTISAMVFVIIIGARMFSLTFRGLGGADYVEELLQALPGGAFSAIFIVMLVMFILGFFLDFLEIIFIVVPIVAPVLLKLTMSDGEMMSPVWLGVMMAINLQTSFLTPPFGFALFYLRGVAPASVTTMHIYRGIIPFVIIQFLALALLWRWPFLATWLPVALYGR